MRLIFPIILKRKLRGDYNRPGDHKYSLASIVGYFFFRNKTALSVAVSVMVESSMRLYEYVSSVDSFITTWLVFSLNQYFAVSGLLPERRKLSGVNFRSMEFGSSLIALATKGVDKITVFTHTQRIESPVTNKRIWGFCFFGEPVAGKQSDAHGRYYSSIDSDFHFADFFIG